MTINTILTIVVIVATVVLLGTFVYLYVRDNTLNEIRADVYKLFLKVENNPAFEKTGKQKMKWVLQQARGLLPNWMQVIITDTFLEKVVQKWFEAVKDLLDDGKMNKSQGEEE